MEIIKLTGKKYYLKTLLTEDVTDRYVSWLNDSEINQFLEVRFCNSTVETVINYIKTFDNITKFLFGIYTFENDQHIGNITLNINKNHNTAYMGYLIGDKHFWGKAASMEAVTLLLIYSFHTLKTRKVWGGAYTNNIGSVFNFKKMEFTQEARLREHNYAGDKLTDGLIYSMLKREWLEKEDKFKKEFLD